MERLGSGADGPPCDVHAAKARLLSALGDAAAEYWALIRAFCAARLDRSEFVERVLHILTPDLSTSPGRASHSPRQYPNTTHLCLRFWRMHTLCRRVLSSMQASGGMAH